MAAFMATELFSVALLFFSLLAQMTPEAMSSGPITPKAMVIGAYTAMIGVIVGGVIQVLQLFVNSKNSRLEHDIRERDIRDAAKEEARVAIEAARVREIEAMKTQTEILRQHAIWSQGWQNTILNQKPGEPYAPGPTFDLDPKTSTPQAVEHSKTMPLLTSPLVETPVPPLVPVPPEILNSSSGLLPAIGTQNAPIRENTEALKDNTEAVKEASGKL